MNACLICRFVQDFQIIDYENAREEIICVNCGSTWRERKLIYLILKIIGVHPEIFDKFQLDYSHRIIGIGDSFRVQSALGSKFNYVNTFLDRFPTIDIEEVPDDIEKFDVVSCSDVLEHVVNLEKSIIGLEKLVKKGGFVVISAPMIKAGVTIEHYPDLQNFRVNADKSIIWKDSKDEIFQDPSPIFHGGEGNVLEIRIISRSHLERLLINYGFIISSSEAFDEGYGIFPLENDGFILAEKI